jgi:uncharacterized RDD family membrane protein YckC
VIRICSKCGALLLDDTESCSFCAVDAAECAQAGKFSEPIAVAVKPLDETPEPEWRMEVSRRLELYRARRGYARNDDESQSGLPFHRHAPAVHQAHQDHEDSEVSEVARPRPAPRATRVAERVDICIQPELNFASSPEDRARPQTALVPVAPLGDRRWAAFLDAISLALTCLSLVGLFHWAGGQLTLAKTDAMVYLAVAYLFFAIYFSIFTVFAGATPGMQLMGLTVVRLDGSLPDTRQLIWRTFGYLISGATLMLGFAWAVWDEDRFTWQDRMSQTYITAAAPLVDLAPIEVHAASRRYAHK